MELRKAFVKILENKRLMGEYSTDPKRVLQSLGVDVTEVKFRRRKTISGRRKKQTICLGVGYPDSGTECAPNPGGPIN